MDEENKEVLEELAERVIDRIDNFVPVIGNGLFTKDGDTLFPDFLSFFDRQHREIFHSQRHIKVSEKVVKFLQLGRFKLILTTSPVGVLDKALKDAGVKVETYYHRWNDKDSTNCLQLQPDTTLIYHLLGGFDENKMPQTENEFIKCLSTYHNDLYNSLPDLLNGKEILLLGSDVPNWMFLLMWYPLLRNSGIRHLFKQDGMADHDFNEYLSSLNFKNKQTMEMFLDLVIEKLSRSRAETTDTDRFEYDVFLSFKGADTAFADKLYERLTDVEGLRVWYMNDRDDTTDPGEYKKRIDKGISSSRTFVVAIGQHYFEYLKDYKKKHANWRNINLIENDSSVLYEMAYARNISDSICASTGLDFFEIPVFDCDALQQDSMEYAMLILEGLGLAPDSWMKFSYGSGPALADMTPFDQINWEKVATSQK